MEPNPIESNMTVLYLPGLVEEMKEKISFLYTKITGPDEDFYTSRYSTRHPPLTISTQWYLKEKPLRPFVVWWEQRDTPEDIFKLLNSFLGPYRFKEEEVYIRIIHISYIGFKSLSLFLMGNDKQQQLDGDFNSVPSHELYQFGLLRFNGTELEKTLCL